MRLSWAIATICALLQTAAAQQGNGVRIRSAPYHPRSDVIAVESTLAELDAIVRNTKGVAVGGFAASDFQVLDEGRPQKIVFFEEERADTPSVPAEAVSGGSQSTAPQRTAAKPPALRLRSIALRGPQP